MSKLHRDNAGYVGCSYEDTQDPYYSYNKLSLPLSGATETVQRPAEVTHTVTVAGGKFVIGGVSQATLSLIEGGTYKFDQSDSSNSTHPFKFSQTSDGTHNRGTEYTKGVTYVGTPGSSGAYTQLVVPFGGLDLYYYCGNHSGMGGSASTPANAGMFTAALPILKTTDQFGKTLGSGTNADPFAANLVLALPMNGSNGGTTFTDQSAAIRGTGSAKTINRNGNTQTSTAQSFFYGSSAEFDGTDDNLKLPVSSDFQFGSGDFTIETWFRPNTTSRMAIYHGSSGTDWSVGIDYSYITQTIAIWASSNGTSWNLADGDSSGNRGTTVVPVGAWTHIAYVRDGGRLLLFVNGNLDKEFSVSGSIVDRSSAQPVIGEWYNSIYDLNGYLADFRIYKGVAKYRPEESSELGFQALSYLGDGGTQKIGGPVYTDQISGTQFSGSYSKDKAFDGNLDNRTFAAVGTANLVFTPDPAITVSSSLRLRIKADSTGNSGALSVNGVDYSSSIQSNSNWLTIPNVTSLTSISFGKSTGSGHEMSSLAAIEVDGVILRNGNGSNIPFKPDFVWLKNDGSTTGHHCLYDSVRGVYKHIQTSSTATEYTENTGRGLSSFNSDGFTLDTSNGEHVGEGNINVSGQRYSAYAWKAGGAATTITAGSLNNSAYDQSQTWSGLWSTSGTTYGSAAALHDATVSTASYFQMVGTGTFTLPSALTVTSLRIYTQVYGTGGTVSINGTDVTSQLQSSGIRWTEITGFTSLSSISVTGTDGNNLIGWYAIELNGKLLIDSGISVTNVPSIASSVSTNSEYGFSIGTYSGTGSLASVAHNLGAIPDLLICKGLNGSGLSWATQFLGSGNSYFEVNSQGGNNTTDASNAWGADSTQHVFSIKTKPTTNEIPANGNSFVFYAWKSVPGFSKISSYTGTGASGNVVTTGFRPSFLLIKADIAGEDWIIMDDARTPVNPVNDAFFANTGTVPNATSVYNVDFNDDGFTINNTNPRFNTNTATYYYMAIGGRKPSDPGQDAFKILDTLSTKDHSSSAHTVTNNGASFQTAVSKFYGGSAATNSGYKVIQVTSDDFNVGTNDFTIEFWAYSTSSSNDTVYRRFISTNTNSANSIQIGHIGSNTGRIRYTHSDGGNYAFGPDIDCTNRWVHVAAVRESGVVSLYVDGQRGATLADANAKTQTTLWVSGYSATQGAMAGYIQDIKFYANRAKYTSSFSPPERSIQGTARRYPSGIYVVS